jgi:hypothetical protein
MPTCKPFLRQAAKSRRLPLAPWRDISFIPHFFSVSFTKFWENQLIEGLFDSRAVNRSRRVKPEAHPITAVASPGRPVCTPTRQARLPFCGPYPVRSSNHGVPFFPQVSQQPP